MKNPTCPYCGKRSEFADTKRIYGRSYGKCYICVNYPKCDSYVGVHRGANDPLGRMANAELREWKKLAHAAFDPKWKSGLMRRSDAYGWLAGVLGIPKSECHIGMFDVAMCQQVVNACKEGES